MTDSEIANIISSFGPARWMKGSLADLPGEGWFLLEVSPLPLRGELHKIVADIEHSQPVRIVSGQLRHLSACDDGDHVLTVNQDLLNDAMQKLRNQKFRLAVHPGIQMWYQGQPLAIAFDPAINYHVFPGHPHLNAGGYNRLFSQQLYVPDTLCYEEDVASLGSDPVQRLKQTFAYISIWIFRHMIWTETAKRNKGYWIGPEAESLTVRQRAAVRNPTGPCRCGSPKRYIDCHMPVDRNLVNVRTKHHIIDGYRDKMERQERFYAEIKRLSRSVQFS